MPVDAEERCKLSAEVRPPHAARRIEFVMTTNAAARGDGLTKGPFRRDPPADLRRDCVRFRPAVKAGLTRETSLRTQ